MSDQELAAKIAVESVLKTLGVVRVVFVDDLITYTPTIEDTIAAALNIDAAVLQPLFPELSVSPLDDPDILRQKIRDIWPTLKADDQSERGKTIIAAARRHTVDEAGDVDNAADIAILEQIVPRNRLISLPPSEWDLQQATLLKESQNIRTLFIFDRDLSLAGGDSESGINIIASLLSANDTKGIICGLLTHTVTLETQLEQWEYLSKTHGIPQERFVVIPKLYLSKDPILFAQILKIAVLSPDFAELKRKTREVIHAAAKAAEDRVEKVNLYDLDHIVFQVSAKEGLWEPDMLFRLHAMFHHKESRQLAHDGDELEAIAARLRAMSEIPTHSAHLPIPGSAWALQHEELYEGVDYINKNYLPLELGDIFEKTDSSSEKKYILLAQPCDLMVRRNGKRHPEPPRIPVVEIVLAGKDKAPQYSEEIPYFDTSPTKKWYVNFKSIHYVRGCLLDLCVFNQDGVARLTFGEIVPSGIRPSWKKRYDFLSRHWKRAVGKADILATVDTDSQDVRQCKNKIAKDLRGRLFDDDLFKAELDEGKDGVSTITYNCKRVRRLSRARAIGLLMSYTATLGRPAYDRTFGEVS